jgi:hypothetical protein
MGIGPVRGEPCGGRRSVAVRLVATHMRSGAPCVGRDRARRAVRFAEARIPGDPEGPNQEHDRVQGAAEPGRPGACADAAAHMPGQTDIDGTAQAGV